MADITQNIHSALYISLQNILWNFCFFLFTQDCTQMKKKKNNKKIKKNLQTRNCSKNVKKNLLWP